MKTICRLLLFLLLALVCLAALMLFLSARAANAPKTLSITLPAAPSSVTVEQDDRAAILQWDGFPKAVVPSGTTGFQIKWGPIGGSSTVTAYVAEPVIELQPLTNGVQYSAIVTGIDAFGNLGAASTAIVFTGDSSRVDALRQAMNGFFDDFNLAAGAVDELKWNTAYSNDNVAATNGFFINDQFHVHSMLASGLADRGQAVSRPRAPFLIAGRTGTITFDFDGAQRRDIWYLDIMPAPLDMNSQINLDTLTPGYPGNMLRIRQDGQFVRIQFAGADGSMRTLADSGPLVVKNIRLVQNVRRHWKVTISQSLVQVFIGGTLVVSSPVSIPWTVGYPCWTAFSYNTRKENEPQTLFHWDNFGFDAPAGWQPSEVVHNYRSFPNDGSEFVSLVNSSHTSTVQIPDPLAGATSAILKFTLQCANNKSYAWQASDSVTVNGGAGLQAFAVILIPKPTGPAGAQLVGGNAPYNVSLALPLKVLQQGLNTCVFSLHQSGLLGVHIEVSYPARAAALYTQPSGILALNGMEESRGMPVLPLVGPGVTLSTLNGSPLYTIMQGTAAETAARPQTVSGVLMFGVNAHSAIALQAVGKACGVSRVDFLVDKKVVASQSTANVCPAVAGDYTFTLDTATLSNGRHEVAAEAVSPLGAPSIPDYTAGDQPFNPYYPLIINVAN